MRVSARHVSGEVASDTEASDTSGVDALEGSKELDPLQGYLEPEHVAREGLGVVLIVSHLIDTSINSQYTVACTLLMKHRRWHKVTPHKRSI